MWFHLLLKVFTVIPKTKKIGKMKDEMDGNTIKEFVGLRAKMYSILTNNKKEDKKAKEVKKFMVKQRVRHPSYVECFLNERTYLQVWLRLDHRAIFEPSAITQNKKSLIRYDDKRHLLEDEIHALSHDHYKIPEN